MKENELFLYSSLPFAVSHSEQPINRAFIAAFASSPPLPPTQPTQGFSLAFSVEDKVFP